jgi:hypothetical protein
MLNLACRRFSAASSFAGPLILALLLGALPVSAQPAPVSWGFGERVELRALPLLGGGIPIHSPAQPVARSSSEGGQTVSGPVSAVTTPLTGNVLTTGWLGAQAATSQLEAGSASASATVLNARLRLLGLQQLLTVSADVIRSSASLAYACSSLQQNGGSSEIVHLVLGGVLGAAIPIPVAFPPNTVLLDVGGLKLILNEQIFQNESGAPVRLTVNALHVIAAGVVSSAGILSGDVILAQSHAEVGCGEDDPGSGHGPQ